MLFNAFTIKYYKIQLLSVIIGPIKMEFLLSYLLEKGYIFINISSAAKEQVNIRDFLKSS